MLPNAFIEIIILLVLANCFEKKIIPQIIIIFLSLFIGISEFISGSDFRYMFFFAVIMLYSGILIHESGTDVE